jgi:quinoprotein glucose dehydrogenase
MSRRWKAALPAVLAFALAPCGRPASGQDWPEYLGNAGRTHYSPLAQVTAANVSQLKVAWEYHTGEQGTMECNPIVVDGVLYGATPTSQVFALDGATGKQVWRFMDPREPASWENNRGVTFWTDGHERRILCTIGEWLYAIDARTGAAIVSFGNGGRVSLRIGLGPQAQEKYVNSTTPGTTFGDLIFMPTRVSEDQDAAPGYIQAFNVRTGTLAWVFRTMPYPSEPGYETWSKDAYKNIDVGSANCWTGMAIDREKGVLFAPTGSAAPDFWGGHRLGQDLFANCLLALDAATGKLLWYRQIVHHDIWQRDLPSPPVLLTVHRNGRNIEAVAQTTKTGFVLVFDRASGEPLYPLEERPFPPSTLAGEVAWPTQPLPLAPQPFARQSLSEDDISPYADNRGELLDQLRSSRRGLFQPFGTDVVMLFPGFDGGGEWGGPAVDPAGVLYVNANEMAWLVKMTETPKESELSQMSPGRRLYTQYCLPCHGAERKGLPAGGIPSLIDVSSRVPRAEISSLITNGRRMMYGIPALSAEQKDRVIDFLFGVEQGDTAAAQPAQAAPGKPPRTPYRFNGYNRFVDSRGHPAISPPWGTLTAIDLNTGDRLWQVPLGEFKDLADKGVPATGIENYGGPVVTAGGLVFIAATKDGRFRAFDRKSGKVLWQVDLPAAAFATPAVYEVEGKQYIALACGGTKLDTPKGDSYVAFALP